MKLLRNVMYYLTLFCVVCTQYYSFKYDYLLYASWSRNVKATLTLLSFLQENYMEDRRYITEELLLIF